MKPTILIIDDDTSLRRVLEYNLQEAGYSVAAAAGGEEGLRLFAEVQPFLVISDMKMPGMDGMQVLQSVKQRSPETPVIMITAFGSVDMAVEAMKAGAYDYITKPFNRDELRLTVAKALQFCTLSQENRQLKSQLADRADFSAIIGGSAAMEKVFQVVAKVADTEASVLITGESGTGKELVARSIHSRSSRKSGPFVAINCAAIPHDLLESELFGHVKGAFTGAVRDKTGKFSLADGGTLFLDEVGELPPLLQPKLLRALQERVIEPVGGTKEQKLDVRVVAATNLDMEKAISDGAFREDLYYRLAVIPLHLPPLRQRRDDIPLLLRHFCGRHGAEAVQFDKAALATLVSYPWPGNVRELENLVERLLIMRNGDTITAEELPEKVLHNDRPVSADTVVNLPPEGYSLEQLEREVVVQALERNNWNQTAAARFLRIPRHTLIYRMEKYAITPPSMNGAEAKNRCRSRTGGFAHMIDNLHRWLVLRLALVWLVLSLIIGGVVQYIGNTRLDNHVVAMAKSEAANYSGEFTAYLQSPSEAHLALFKNKIQRLIENDHLIVVEFYDAASRKIAEAIKHSAVQVESALPKHGSGFIAQEDAFTQKLSLGKDTYLRVFIPVYGRDKLKMGYMEGIYHAPAEIVSQIQQQSLWSLILVVMVVLATSLALYPLIIRLNSRLLEYSHILALTNVGMLKVLGSAIAKRDSDTNIHNYRVTLYSGAHRRENGTCRTLSCRV